MEGLLSTGPTPSSFYEVAKFTCLSLKELSVVFRLGNVARQLSDPRALPLVPQETMPGQVAGILGSQVFVIGICADL